MRFGLDRKMGEGGGRSSNWVYRGREVHPFEVMGAVLRMRER